ncbi:hypothetical protein D3C71_898490 [compost metagenome]
MRPGPRPGAGMRGEAAAAGMGHATTAEAAAAEAAGVADGGVGETAQARSCLRRRRGQQGCRGEEQQRGADGGAQGGDGVHAQFPSAEVSCAARATGTNTIRVAPRGLKVRSAVPTARCVSQCSVAW